MFQGGSSKKTGISVFGLIGFEHMGTNISKDRYSRTDVSIFKQFKMDILVLDISVQLYPKTDISIYKWIYRFYSLKPLNQVAQPLTFYIPYYT